MKDAFFKSVYGNINSQYFYDIGRSWAVILVASFAAILVGYLYLIVLRYLGGNLVWISFFLTVCTLIGAGFYSYFYARL
jgi:hypothetical protein